GTENTERKTDFRTSSLPSLHFSVISVPLWFVVRIGVYSIFAFLGDKSMANPSEVLGAVNALIEEANRHAAASGGTRAASLQRAITCYADALRLITPAEQPFQWAMIHNALGAAYRGLPSGEVAAN